MPLENLPTAAKAAATAELGSLTLAAGQYDLTVTSLAIKGGELMKLDDVTLK